MTEGHDTPDAGTTIAGRALFVMALGALGVVYGDIGTSPLYAVKECFSGAHAVPPTPENVLGVISLVLWILLLSVTIKYIGFVMRAENRGEGGIMALLALILPVPSNHASSRRVRVLLALFGASLLFAEGMITPAISVLSAVEGLEVATPVFRRAVVPITLAILVGLFLVQRRGTAKVAAFFGPAMVVWFLAIAALGLPWIVRAPAVLAALNPLHGMAFFMRHGWHGFLVLGSVVLCITGAEALYADMGHFGSRPIRVAWFALVYPALLINYFGQGGILLVRGASAAQNPFYALAPAGMLYPVVAIATIATVIASQALISGAFSISRQAVQLGYCPRLTIIHTSSETRGQIYIPEINSCLMVACILLVLAFRSSSGLAAAYGLSVTGTMTITSVLMYTVFRSRWKWSRLRALSLIGLFFTVDISLFGANLSKLMYGGWVPLAIGIVFFSVLTTWKYGRTILAQELRKSFLPISEFIASIEEKPPVRVPGTAVFMTSNQDVVPPVLLHHLAHSRVLHEQTVLLSVVNESIPFVVPKERVKVTARGHGVYQVEAHYGFMEQPHVPDVLKRATKHKLLHVDLQQTSYFLGRESLLTSGTSPMSRWRKALFAFLARNALPATSFFHIPVNRVVEMGMQIEL